MTGRISCELQDHFEHAVVLRLSVRCLLTNGTTLTGTASGLSRVGGEEQLQLNQSGGSILVPLTRIRTLWYPDAYGQEADADGRWRRIDLGGL